MSDFILLCLAFFQIADLLILLASSWYEAHILSVKVYLLKIPGYKAYLGMLEVEIYHTHPLLKAFIMILQEQVHDTKSRRVTMEKELGCKILKYSYQ